MHICYITSEYPILDFAHGGIGTFVRSLAYKLIEKGHQISVIRISAVEAYQEINDNGVKIHLVPMSKMPFAFFFNSLKINAVLKKIQNKKRIDVVETAELGLAFLSKIKSVRYIIRMHGGHHFFAKAENRPLEWKKVWQEKRSFAKADAIIAVSNYVAETTKVLLGIQHKSVEVIYNPIDTKRFHQAQNEKIEKHTLFFAGSIIEKKGIRQLVQSLDYLIDEYPDIKLTIAGRDANLPGTRQPYRPVLEKSISEKARPHILFLGPVSNFEIPTLIEKAQVCCYPSHMEAMPLAWLEVLAMGKVFLGSNTGPGTEAVIEGETGFLVNPHDPKAIAEKIKFILKNYDDALKMGVRARESMVKTFDIAVLVEKNVEFYSVLAQK